MGKRKAFVWLVVVAFAVLSAGVPVRVGLAVGGAVPGVDDVLINEVVTDPQADWDGGDFSGTAGGGTVSSSDEYVELYNASGAAVDLTNVKLVFEDSAVDEQLIEDGVVYGADYVGDVSMFEPGDHWVIGNPLGAMNNDVNVKLVYDDGGAGVVLDEVTLGVFDDGDLTDNAVGGNASGLEDEAVSRVSSGLNTGDDTLDFVAQAQTMGSDNASVVPPVVDSDVVINELLPNPDGSDEGEWVELYNQGSDSAVIENWKLVDADGDEFVFGASHSIAAGGYLVIDKAESGLVLNNGSEDLALLDELGQQVDLVTYGSAREGESYALTTDVSSPWQWTETLTPGAVNVITQDGGDDGGGDDDDPFSLDLSSILDARGLGEGSEVHVSGVIVSTLGQLGSNIMYIQDETAGVQIHSPIDIEQYAVGDVVEVVGETDSYLNESQIDLSAIRKVGEQEAVALQIKTEDMVKLVSHTREDW